MARSMDDWYANAWASEPDRTPVPPRQRASTKAGANKLPRRPVGATRLLHPGKAPDHGRDESVTREIQAAMQRIRGGTPGIRARRLARRLRDRGWPAIGLGEVRALLEQTPPPQAGHQRSQPPIDRTVGVRQWPVRQRTLICRACGVAVSVRGICRCS